MIIVGCGYVGQRLAQQALMAGVSVTAIVKTAESRSQLASLGIDVPPVDLDDQHPRELPEFAGTDVFYLVPPPPVGTSDPRMTRFLAMLNGEQPPRRIVLISTTAVYGSANGDWVDESAATEPVSDRGQRRLDAEEQLKSWCDRTGCEWVLLRVAGIYGPQRLPLERLRQGMPMVTAEDAPWTNRIHVDDLVSVLEAALAQPCAREIFNVSDGEPGNMRQYFDQIADLAGLPRSPAISLDEARGKLSAGMLSYLAESRRINNHRMLERLAVTLQYPDLDSGLRQALGEHG